MISPQIIPITDMRYRHTEVLEKLAKGPIFLTRHGSGEAVLLSTQQWEKLMAHLEDQADIIDALEAKLELATGQDHTEEIDANELKVMIRGERLPA